jgi:hypothetical protein
MFARLHVMPLSVKQCGLISQLSKKLNFAAEINNQCYTYYVYEFVRNVTFVPCSKEYIFPELSGPINKICQ